MEKMKIMCEETENFRKDMETLKKKLNQKEFLELKNIILEINSLSIKSKFGNIGKRIYELDDRLIEITQTE